MLHIFSVTAPVCEGNTTDQGAVESLSSSTVTVTKCGFQSAANFHSSHLLRFVSPCRCGRYVWCCYSPFGNLYSFLFELCNPQGHSHYKTRWYLRSTVHEKDLCYVISALGFLFSFQIYMYHCDRSQHRNTSLYLLGPDSLLSVSHSQNQAQWPRICIC